MLGEAVKAGVVKMREVTVMEMVGVHVRWWMELSWE